MKKLLMLILSLTMATVAFTSCNLFEMADPSTDSSASESVETPKEKTFKVTFKQTGEEDVVVEVKEGESLSGDKIPTPKAKVGYDVVWEDVNLTNIKADIVVEAVLTAKTYTITYNAAGGTCPSTQKVVFDSVVTLAEPELKDHQFICWLDEEGKTVSSGKWTIASDVTLTAKWKKVEAETVTIIFKNAAGTTITTKTIEKGASLTEEDIPAFPLDTGYEYSWSEDDFTNITEDMTVTLNVTAKTFTITYDPNGGTITSGEATQSVIYGTLNELKYPKAEKPGFDCTGWEYKDGTLPSGNWNIASDVTLYAVWVEQAAETVTITFKGAAGNVIATETIEKGTTLSSVPALPTQDGYTFTWDKKTDVAFEESTVITAVPKANEYTVTYDPNGGEITSGEATQKVTYDADYDLVYPTATRSGYKCVGWEISEGSLPTTGKWTIAKDVTMVAKWKEIKYYTVTFVQTGQEPKEFDNIEEGTAFTSIPEVVKKVGYTIVWNEEDLAKLTEVKGNVIVNAEETANKYTVTFKNDKGEVTKTETVTYDVGYDFTPEDVVTGHSFTLKEGDTDFAVSGTWTVARDVELTIVWVADTYTVKLNANEGTCSQATIEVTYGESFKLPTPTRNGYIFEGWYQGDNKVDMEGTWTLTGASIELKAKWRNEEWTKNY